MDRLLCYLLVFLGGGTGALLRYLTNLDGVHPFMPGNLLACFLIGITYAIARYRIFINKYYQSFTILGFLGGLSTFTPLALFAVYNAESNFILACLFLFGEILGFFIMAILGYNLAALFFIYVLHRQPMPSISAAFRAFRHNRARRRSEHAEDKKTAELLHDILDVQKELKTLEEQEKKLSTLDTASTTNKAELSSDSLSNESIAFAKAHGIAYMQAGKINRMAYKKALKEYLNLLKQQHKNEVLGNPTTPKK